MQLTAIEAVDEKLQGSLQGFWAARKTARAPGEPRQIMAQFGVIAFHRVGVRFALRDLVDAPVIPQALVGIEGVTVVAPGFGSFIHQLLDHGLGSLPDDFEAQIAVREAVYDRDDEDLVFLSPMKVNSSSSSAASTALGSGGSGSWAAWAWTHRETVR